MSDWIDDFVHGPAIRDSSEEAQRKIELTLDKSVAEELDKYLEELRWSQFVPKSRDTVVTEALLHWFEIHTEERIIARAFLGLKSRECLVMYAYLFGKPRPSLAAIARGLQIHPSKVYRIRRKALRKMRTQAHSEAFEALLGLIGRTPENYRRLGLDPKSAPD